MKKNKFKARNSGGEILIVIYKNLEIRIQKDNKCNPRNNSANIHKLIKIIIMSNNIQNSCQIDKDSKAITKLTIISIIMILTTI